MDYEDAIRISTISLVNITAEDAADAMWARGFHAIEIFLGVPGSGSYGHPAPHPGAAIWPRECSADRRRSLRCKLERFEHVTVHAQLADNNIASLNPGIREESVEQYLECIDFAHDIGAPLVTFHAGACGHSSYPGVFNEESKRANLEFAERAAERCAQYGLRSGYEGTHYSGVDISAIVSEVDADDFGLLVDITQSYLTTTPNVEPILNGIERCSGRIVEVHLHGGLHRTIGRISHLPLRLHNMVDFGTVFEKLLAAEFAGPMMFEITSSADPLVVIEDCVESKEMVLDILDGLETQHQQTSG
ncbi:MAG: sugar phosphate isomerase/epimerase family protein [Candidatus Latescibacteria bacterium]|jgi:sugar phosphate isomerase/epimerase|nr:sugar phosphate isomerase/epimerase family protein [Candidatus Latescibacterota bacterium]